MSTDSHRSGRRRERQRTPAETRWRDAALARIAAAGHRSGGARAAVVDLLAEEDCCLTAQEIHDALRAEGRRVGLASVYRALDVLVRLGLLHRLDLGGGTARYEAARSDHHHHVVCVACGKVSAFADRALEAAIERLAQRQDYDVDGHDVVLRGTCPQCRAA
jgi:Fur family ferric uptake transcriptional regulator